MTYTKKEEKKSESKFDLVECFALWRKVSKEKMVYYSGLDFNKNRIVAFENTKKKNEKEPDIRVYAENEDGTRGIEIISLWKTTYKSGNEGYMGETNEHEKLICYLGDINKEQRPFIRGYFRKQEENK